MKYMTIVPQIYGGKKLTKVYIFDSNKLAAADAKARRRVQTWPRLCYISRMKNVVCIQTQKGVSKMSKGKPKRDGSGKGRRANRGRGGCAVTEKVGQGSNRRK